MLSRLSTEKLARVSAAHPWRVIVIWVIVFLVAGGLAGALFIDTVTTEIKFTNDPESDRAQTFLEERLRGERVVTDVLMLRSADLPVDDATYRQTVEELVGKISALGPKIVSAAPTFYQTGDESQVSKNRRSTIVPIVLAGGTAEAEKNIAEVHSIVDGAALPGGFEVFITGEATLAREFTVGAEEDLLSRNYPYQTAWTKATHHPRREPS